MAKAMSAKLGVPFTYTGTSFEVILPGLAAHRFDAGFASFAPTPDRLKVLDFIPQRSDGTAYSPPPKGGASSYGLKPDLVGPEGRLATQHGSGHPAPPVSGPQCISSIARR